MAVAVFAVVFAVAVAEMEAKIYQDGKRAVEGFGHGYMTFGVLALIAVFAFGRFYKAIIGARVWVVIGLLLPPALGVAYLFLH